MTQTDISLNLGRSDRKHYSRYMKLQRQPSEARKYHTPQVSTRHRKKVPCERKMDTDRAKPPLEQMDAMDGSTRSDGHKWLATF
jgi:hypothetical protein